VTPTRSRSISSSTIEIDFSRSNDMRREAVRSVSSSSRAASFMASIAATAANWT
jgi:hypothetical protein